MCALLSIREIAFSSSPPFSSFSQSENVPLLIYLLHPSLDKRTLFVFKRVNNIDEYPEDTFQLKSQFKLYVINGKRNILCSYADHDGVISKLNYVPHTY